jgi:2,4-dienoyl-CoA reductase-like NADH-dependent reductase (Old Yellow Enzyme family)
MASATTRLKPLACRCRLWKIVVAVVQFILTMCCRRSAVRNLRLRNRMVMGAMHTRLESLDRPVQRIQAFYRARAAGEIALIITGGISPNLAGRMEDDAPAMTARCRPGLAPGHRRRRAWH